MCLNILKRLFLKALIKDLAVWKKEGSLILRYRALTGWAFYLSG